MSALAMADTNTELDQRREHIQTILENIPTGVLSLDAERRVTHTNVALGRMFWPKGGAPVAGTPLHEIFPPEVTSDLEHLLRKSDRSEEHTSELQSPDHL